MRHESEQLTPYGEGLIGRCRAYRGRGGILHPGEAGRQLWVKLGLSLSLFSSPWGLEQTSPSGG